MSHPILIVVLAILCSAAQAKAAKYESYKCFEVTPETDAQVQVLQSLAAQERNYDFVIPSREPGRAARVLVNAQAESDFLLTLRQHKIRSDLLHSNVLAKLRSEWRFNTLMRLLEPYRQDTRMGTQRYYTHDEINAYIEDLPTRFPSRVFVKTVGKSYEDRLLKTITITNGDGRANKNVILMDGGFHAREWISPAAVVYAIGELVENFTANAELLLDYDWVILPVVNADGYEYTQKIADSRQWRKTRKPTPDEQCIGTDPNRNFDFHWKEAGASSDPCSNTYAGPKAFSEPEAVVIRDLIHTFQSRGIMYLTVHSCGQYVLYPWGWSSALPDTWEDLHEVAMAGANAIKAYNGAVYTVGSSTNALYVAAGASDDYAFNAGFPISFTMELPCGGDFGFNPPPSDIDRMVKETWVGIRAMAVKLKEKYPLH